MEIKQYKYIADTPDVELAATVKQFCDLCDIETPKQAKEFINLLRLGFGRYPFEMLEKAFTAWMLNKSQVRSVKSCNIKWISDLLNEYIENNRHNLHRKPKTYVNAIEAPNSEPVDVQSMVRKMFDEIKTNHRAVVFPSIFAQAWDQMPPQKVKRAHYDRYLELVKNREMYNLISNKALRGKHKVKRDYLPEVVIQKAALMMAYLEGGNND